MRKWCWLHEARNGLQFCCLCHTPALPCAPSCSLLAAPQTFLLVMFTGEWRGLAASAAVHQRSFQVGRGQRTSWAVGGALRRLLWQRGTAARKKQWMPHGQALQQLLQPAAAEAAARFLVCL